MNSGCPSPSPAPLCDGHQAMSCFALVAVWMLRSSVAVWVGREKMFLPLTLSPAVWAILNPNLLTVTVSLLVVAVCLLKAADVGAFLYAILSKLSFVVVGGGLWTMILVLPFVEWVDLQKMSLVLSSVVCVCSFAFVAIEMLKVPVKRSAVWAFLNSFLLKLSFAVVGDGLWTMTLVLPFVVV